MTSLLQQPDIPCRSSSPSCAAAQTKTLLTRSNASAGVAGRGQTDDDFRDRENSEVLNCRTFVYAQHMRRMAFLFLSTGLIWPTNGFCEILPARQILAGKVIVCQSRADYHATGRRC